jgi:hypothetical protein
MSASSITPTPSDEEAAAIAAAIECAWPRSVPLAIEADPPTQWRFSGRWWNKPVAASRSRPWM